MFTQTVSVVLRMPMHLYVLPMHLYVLPTTALVPHTQRHAAQLQEEHAHTRTALLTARERMARGQPPVEGDDVLLEAMFHADAMVHDKAGACEPGNTGVVAGEGSHVVGPPMDTQQQRQRRPTAYLPEGGTTTIPFGALAPFKPTVQVVKA